MIKNDFNNIINKNIFLFYSNKTRSGLQMAIMTVSPRRHSKIKFFTEQMIGFLLEYAVRYHVPPSENRKLLFIFDDGPLPSTLGVLDILDEYKEKAVFFLVAENVQKYPQIAMEIVRRGHSIGSHGLHHTNIKKTVSAGVFASDERKL